MDSKESLIPLKIAVLTVSDTRTEADDKSGKILVESLTTVGHDLAEKFIVPDDIYQIRAVVSRWIADDFFQVILTTGRSEEHTSELQSPDHLVCRLLLEKKKLNITSSFCSLYIY